MAVLTISASTGYAAGECIGVRSTASTTRRAAPRSSTAPTSRVALIAAGVILIPGAPLLSIALNANVLATVLLPVTLVFMIMLANDRELMGRLRNGALLNRVAIAIVAFVSICGAAYGIDSFLRTAHLI